MNFQKNKSILKLTQMGILSALSLALLLLLPGGIPLFPQTPWLRYDLADVPVLVGALLLGNFSGMGILFVVAWVQALFFSTDGWVGFFMHFVATACLLNVLAFFVKKKESHLRAYLGVGAGMLTMVFVMTLLNLYFVPLVYALSFDMALQFLPFTIAFNVIKASLNGVFAVLIWQMLRKNMKSLWK